MYRLKTILILEKIKLFSNSIINVITALTTIVHEISLDVI